MALEHETADFLSADFQASAEPTIRPSVGAAGVNRPLTKEELEQRVVDTQQRLSELKRAQEKLEKERAALEEARRRRTELHTGREEMVTNLTRGITLLEEAEFSARHNAEQMAKTLADFRDAAGKVQSIHEEQWNEENWSVELTRALTVIENARMEWNSARLKWPTLNPSAPESDAATAKRTDTRLDLFAQLDFGKLCKIGLALTWPVAVAVIAGIAIALMLRR